MNSLRQMVLVPAGQLVEHRPSEPQQQRLSELDKEMERILNTAQLSDDEKSKKYLAALHNYLRLNLALTDQLSRPVPVRLDPTTPLVEATPPVEVQPLVIEAPSTVNKTKKSRVKKVKRLSKSNERWMRY